MKETRKISGGFLFAGAVGLVIVAGSAAPADGAAPLQFSIGEAAQQMKRRHEAKPYGVPESYSWQAQPVVQPGNGPPPGFHAITGWGQIFRARGTAPVSLDVSIKNLRTYVLLTSGKLELIQASNSLDGAQFNTDYRNNASTPAQIGSDADGNTSVVTNPFAAFHFWPTSGKVTFEPRTVRGVVVAVEAKVNLKGRQTAADVDRKLILSVGADYWVAQDSRWDNYRTNVGVGMGRFGYISTEWRCFTMTTITDHDASILSTQVLC